MSRFVLLPHRLREDRLVPIKGAEPIVLNWRELAAKLAPSNRIEAVKTLRHMQRGAFVGLLKQGKREPSNFCFIAQDRSGKISNIIRRNPSFGSNLLEVYRVVESDWGSVMLETDSPAKAQR